MDYVLSEESRLTAGSESSGQNSKRAIRERKSEFTTSIGEIRIHTVCYKNHYVSSWLFLREMTDLSSLRFTTKGVSIQSITSFIASYPTLFKEYDSESRLLSLQQEALTIRFQLAMIACIELLGYDKAKKLYDDTILNVAAFEMYVSDAAINRVRMQTPAARDRCQDCIDNLISPSSPICNSVLRLKLSLFALIFMDERC